MPSTPHNPPHGTSRKWQPMTSNATTFAERMSSQSTSYCTEVGLLGVFPRRLTVSIAGVLRSYMIPLLRMTLQIGIGTRHRYVVASSLDNILHVLSRHTRLREVLRSVVTGHICQVRHSAQAFSAGVAWRPALRYRSCTWMSRL